MTAEDLCILSAGLFFLTGLMTGTWKYVCIAKSPEGRAPAYVDIAHRTSLLYAFACALLGELCRRSAWGEGTNRGAALVLVLFFAITVLGYIVHGALGDTDNQLRRPHRLGRHTLPAPAMMGFMILLIVGEIGAFVVLLSGAFVPRGG